MGVKMVSEQPPGIMAAKGMHRVKRPKLQIERRLRYALRYVGGIRLLSAERGPFGHLLPRQSTVPVLAIIERAPVVELDGHLGGDYQFWL